MDALNLIIRAQAAYVRSIDDGALEAWPDFFTDECRYRVTTADNYQRGLPAGLIWADSKGMLKDRVSALKEANIYEPHSYRHMLGMPAILDETETETGDGTIVHSETPFMVLRITGNGPTDIFASGKYLDTYVFADGKAVLKERDVICDSSRTDTLLALPL